MTDELYSIVQIAEISNLSYSAIKERIKRLSIFPDAVKGKARLFSEEEVRSIIIQTFNKGERYGWESKDGIGNLEEMKRKIELVSLEKLLEQFKNK